MKWQHRFAYTMSRRVNSVLLIVILALAPFANMASAHPNIGVSTDVSHVILSPGETTNITLTVDNDGESIESYEINVSGYDSVWEVIPTSSTLTGVIPTTSSSTTIAVRLATNALPSNSGSMTITVTEPDADISSSITVLLSVQAIYLPSIDSSTAGDNGLVEMDPGQEVNVSIMVQNSGNVNDTILLSIDQSPDLVGFWANWTSGGNGNNSTGGNNTGSNSTAGNDTGDNTTTGNSTGGNSTTGNSTGDNSTAGNSTGGNGTTGNGTGNGSLMISTPVGWEVRFDDFTLDVMEAQEIRYATLKIAIPSNELPGYYGFDLFAASALGNFSVSTTLVVEVTATHNLEFSKTYGDKLLPGSNTTTQIQLSSLSTADGDWTWSVSTNSVGCDVELTKYETTIMMGSTETIEVVTSVGPNTNVGDECNVELFGTLDTDSTITETYLFTNYVGESWGLSMVIPSSIKLDVDSYETFNVAITNNGTEQDTLSLIGIDQDGITFTNPSPVTLQRGESQYIEIGVTINSSIVGNITLEFSLSSTNSGQDSIFENGSFEVKPFAALSVTGPQDNRLSVIPGTNSTLTLNLTNLGTRDLEITPSITGLPSGISVVSGLEIITLNSSESLDVELVVSAASGTAQMATNFAIDFSSSWTSASIDLELQIDDRMDVSIDSTQNKVYASPVEDSSITMIITNLGTSSDNFIISLDTSDVNDWFGIGIDKLSLNLNAGESGSAIITVREVSIGAPVAGVTMNITVQSVNNNMVNDVFMVEVIPQRSDGLITISSSDDSGKPGENIHGTISITNLGTSADNLSLTAVELDCNLSENTVRLEPSMSSTPIDWSCMIPENANTGTYALNFRLTSAARSDMIITTAEAYYVEPVWGDSAVEFSIENTKLTFDKNNEQQSITFTICNTANAYIEGVVELKGKNAPLMDSAFYRNGELGLNTSYSLSSGDCQGFTLMLTPLNLDGFNAELYLLASSTLASKKIEDESQTITASVAGPEMAPDGINLGFMELDNKNSMIILLSGWGLAVLLIAYIKLFRKPVEIEEEEEEEEIPLGPNEVRIDEYNKVTCTSCESRLGVPEDSEPPFRFTCPKCQQRIRVVE